MQTLHAPHSRYVFRVFRKWVVLFKDLLPLFDAFFHERYSLFILTFVLQSECKAVRTAQRVGMFLVQHPLSV